VEEVSTRLTGDYIHIPTDAATESALFSLWDRHGVRYVRDDRLIAALEGQSADDEPATRESIEDRVVMSETWNTDDGSGTYLLVRMEDRFEVFHDSDGDLTLEGEYVGVDEASAQASFKRGYTPYK